MVRTMANSPGSLAVEAAQQGISFSSAAFNSLDELMEQFESDIATHGVRNVSLPRYTEFALKQPEPHGKDWFVELLRVWLEHRFRSGEPLDVETLLKPYAHVELSARQQSDLAFEHRRQLQRTYQAGVATLSNLPSVGTQWGEFELIDILGSGAYAHVYLARQTGFANRLVALKLTLRETSEPAWLARLQHTAIVPVYATMQLGDVHGICMPYLGNTTLAELSSSGVPEPSSSKSMEQGTKFIATGQGLLSTLALRQSRLSTFRDAESVPPQGHLQSQKPSSVSERVSSAMETSTLEPKATLRHLERSPAARQLSGLDPIETVLWIAGQVADALAYAHRCGVVHCDLKPANILLGSDGQPRLLDFNVAFDPAMVSKSQGVGGTPAYMAPEQWEILQGTLRQSEKQKASGSLDGRADLYALGVVMYELLTGVLPSRPESTQSAALPPPPSRYRAAISPAVDAIVMRCLMPAPEARYLTADALYEDLQAQLQHRPLLHQREPSTRERIFKWGRRHPKLSSWSAAGALASCFIGCLLVFWWLSHTRSLKEASTAHYRGVQIELPALMAELGTLQPSTWRGALQSFASFCDRFENIPGDDKDWEWTKRLTRPEQSQLTFELQRLTELVHSSQLLAPQRHNVDVAILKDAESRFTLLHKHLQSKTDDAWRTQINQTSLHYGEVLEAIRGGEVAASLDEVDTWLKEQPRDYVGWLIKGMAEQSLDRFDQAEQAYSICIALDRQIPEAWFMRGELRYLQKHFELAETDLSEALALRPGHLASRLNRALNRKELKQYAGALDDVEHVHGEGYRSVRTMRLLAALHRALGDYAQARDAESEAKAIDPVTELDFIEHGLLVVKENPEQAMEDFRKAIVINPQTLLGYQNLASVLASLGKTEEAIEVMDQLIRRHPQEITQRAGRAVLLARRGNLEATAKDLQSLEGISVNDPLLMYQIGSAYAIYAAELSKSTSDATRDANTKKAQTAASKAIRWTAKALAAQPSLKGIVESDPDSQWLRKQDEYASLIQALYGTTSKSPRGVR